MLSTSPDGSADKIQVFDFKMNYKLLSPSTISLYTPTFLSTMLQIVTVIFEERLKKKKKKRTHEAPSVGNTNLNHCPVILRHISVAIEPWHLAMSKVKQGGDLSSDF